MGTHDEKTEAFFKGTGVHVVLAHRHDDDAEPIRQTAYGVFYRYMCEHIKRRCYMQKKPPCSRAPVWLYALNEREKNLEGRIVFLCNNDGN